MRIALLTMTMAVATAAPLRGSENAEPKVSLQRPGYGAITLRSPSPQPGDPSAPDPALQPGSRADAGTQRSSAMPLVTIGSSLAVVLGLFAALVWVSRKTGPAAGRGGVVPEEALRLLGQKSLGASGSIALVRCGRSVLVVGISAAGMQPLTEITDAEQVRNLEALCCGESAASFQTVLGELPHSDATGEFRDEQIAGPQLRKKLFADR